MTTANTFKRTGLVKLRSGKVAAWSWDGAELKASYYYPSGDDWTPDLIAHFIKIGKKEGWNATPLTEEEISEVMNKIPESVWAAHEAYWKDPANW